MPRTAITIARTHAGSWSLISTPDDPMLEQRKAFRAIRAEKVHQTLSTVVYQESDGYAEVARLMTPKEKKKQDEQAAADMKASMEFDAKAKQPKKPKQDEQAAEKPAEAQQPV